MAAPLEVIVSSDSGSQLWNSTVFDLHSGSSLLSYRGGNSSARTLTVLGGQYLMSAQLGKNFINVWEIQRKDQLQQKIVCPGVVTCLTASPDGLFLAAAVAEAVYLWEVSTGKLLSVLSRHYQDVTCLKFTDDGSHFVSGGKDNLALVWSLFSVIQLDLSHTPEPRHVLSRHSLPITDLHCGMMGAQARVATASLDQTVKVWELSSGELLLSVLFDVEIMSVTFDPCEYFLFCGGSDGNIFQVSLCSQNLSRDKSFQSDSDGNQVFKGHRNLVTCLSVSMDGTLLLSGSHDETVRLWDVQSKQSIRCLTHKGLFTSNGLSGDDNPSSGWTDRLVVVPHPRHVCRLSSCSWRRHSQRTRLLKENFILHDGSTLNRSVSAASHLSVCRENTRGLL
ncbi:WD repeat-containing protein 18 isoform X2 [Dicentrarchus labrax]|uniref:WD repeat-containing protein 18 isoform X2 n=1 Tax=Dicentrarchus labrax TaxID=13489 RepID=UPI0021F51F5F|nr:WD repeat-containing protein 18 isoform X2 [Dicentrarchus labrax]